MIARTLIAVLTIVMAPSFSWAQQNDPPDASRKVDVLPLSTAFDVAERVRFLRRLGSEPNRAAGETQALLIRLAEEDPVEAVRVEALLVLQSSLSISSCRTTCVRCCDCHRRTGRRRSRGLIGRFVARLFHAADSSARGACCSPVVNRAAGCDEFTAAGLERIASARDGEGNFIEPSRHVRALAERILASCRRNLLRTPEALPAAPGGSKGTAPTAEPPLIEEPPSPAFEPLAGLNDHGRPSGL